MRPATSACWSAPLIRRCCAVAVVTALILAMGVVPASSVAVLDHVVNAERLNVSSAGTQADHDLPPSTSYSLAATYDGRYVLFHSDATNLVGDDTNAKCDVFVRDRETGVTRRASLSSEGTQVDGHAYAHDISDDGRYIIFQSNVAGFVPGDTNGQADLFMRDLQSNTTTRVVMGVGGVQTNGGSYSADLSPNGRYLVFNSVATNLVAVDGNGVRDVFMRDLESGETTLVSVSSEGTQTDVASTREARVSDDGRYVAFPSPATNLVSGDSNGVEDVFLRDVQAGTTTRISVDTTGVGGDYYSYDVGMSSDGRYVCFTTPNVLDSADTNIYADVYVRDTVNNTTTLASKGEGDAIGNQSSSRGVLSPDGEWIAFVSSATNLVAGDTNGKADVFVRNLQSGAIVRVSVNASGEGGDASAWCLALGDDAAWAMFESAATNLVPDDTNGMSDLFVSEPWTGTSAKIYGPSTAPGYKSAVRLTARIRTTRGDDVRRRAVAFDRWTGSAWQYVGAAKTNTYGTAVKYVPGIASTTKFRVRLAQTAPYRASTSSYVSVKPKARLSRSTSWKSLRRYRTYYAKGFIAPRHSKSDKNKVRIYAYKRRSNGTYRYVRSFKATYSYYSSTKTRYKAAVRLTSRGTWKLVAVHPSDSRNAKTYGSADYVKVR